MPGPSDERATSSAQGRSAGAGRPPVALGRRVAAEFLGTFALTFVAATGDLVAAAHPGAISHGERVTAPALAVLAIIYAFGDVSGAHVNPAVSLAVAARGVLPWRWLLAYWPSQVAGATAAAFVLRALFAAAAHALTPSITDVLPALALEIVLSCLLVTVILATAHQHQILGPDAGIPVAAVIALAGYVAGPVSGASLNPARSLGPALASGRFDAVWIWLAGPALGAVLAVLIVRGLHGPPTADDVRASEGDA